MLCGSSAPVILERKHHPGETHSRQRTDFQETCLHLTLCYALRLLLMRVDFASFVVAQLGDALRGDKGIRADPVEFAV